MSVDNRKTFDAPPRGEASDRYLPLARALSDALWEREPSTGKIAWAEAAHNVFGGLDDVRDDASWQARIHPGDRGRVAAGMEFATRGSSGIWVDEYRFMRASARSTCAT